MTVKVKQYVPYETCAELFGAVCNKRELSLKADVRPLLWVRYKGLPNIVQFVSGFDELNGTITVHNQTLTLEQAFNELEFADGRPFGKGKKA